MSFALVVLVAAGLLSGIFAGFMYGYTYSVVPGLRQMKPDQHIIAMQEINVKIINPAFMVVFLGPVFLLPLATYLYRAEASFPLVLAAAVLYIVGVFGVTAAGNVPMNNRLETIRAEQISEAEAETVRQWYHGIRSRWMIFHNLRTALAIVATALVLITSLGLVG